MGQNGQVAERIDVGRPFRASRASTYLGAFIAGGVGLSALYAVTGVGVPCPFRTLTGWNCPLCGGTRLGAALLHGDLGAAFAYNPLVFVALVVIGGLATAWVVEAAGGPALRPPSRWQAAARRLGWLSWLAVGLTVAGGYTLLRNLI